MGQLYGQRVVESSGGGPWWKRRIESLEADAGALRARLAAQAEEAAAQV